VCVCVCVYIYIYIYIQDIYIYIYVIECQCHIPGVIGSIGECDTKTGQCICKPGVIDRGCTRCVDGTYNLQESNLFGCSGKSIIFLFRNIKFLI